MFSKNIEYPVQRECKNAENYSANRQKRELLYSQKQLLSMFQKAKSLQMRSSRKHVQRLERPEYVTGGFPLVQLPRNFVRAAEHVKHAFRPAGCEFTDDPGRSSFARRIQKDVFGQG